MKILIFGVSGMLGSALYKYFSSKNDYSVVGVLRSSSKEKYFKNYPNSKIAYFKDFDNQNLLEKFIFEMTPNIVINCIGVIKQTIANIPSYESLYINSYLPHCLAKLSKILKFILIHFSTDCIFDGLKGSYKEYDQAFPIDYYGLTELLGEVELNESITIRTSIIGHELSSSLSLVDWFLSSKGDVKGYKKAMYSGMPTFEIAKVLDKFVIPNKSLNGIYHLSSSPVSKYELLNLVAKRYKHNITIIPDNDFIIDRTLDSSKFKSETGYSCPEWSKLIDEMFKFQES